MGGGVAAGVAGVLRDAADGGNAAHRDVDLSASVHRHECGRRLAQRSRARARSIRSDCFRAQNAWRVHVLIKSVDRAPDDLYAQIPLRCAPAARDSGARPSRLLACRTQHAIVVDHGRRDPNDPASRSEGAMERHLDWSGCGDWIRQCLVDVVLMVTTLDWRSGPHQSGVKRECAMRTDPHERRSARPREARPEESGPLRANP